MAEENEVKKEEMEEKTEVKTDEKKEDSEKNEVKIDNNPDKFDVSDVTDKVKKNPWIAATIILALVVAFMFFKGGGITGNVISGDEAGEKFLNFVQAQGAEMDLLEVVDNGLFYEVTVFYQGQELPVYVTKDGEFFTSTLVSLNISNTPAQDRPAQNSDEPDWTIFKNSLDVETSEIILNFNIEDSKQTKQTDNERVIEFESYKECKNKLIVFYHAGCGWCTKYYSVLEQTQKDYPELEVYALDLGENRDIAEKYGATGTPANIINCKYFASGYMDNETLYEILDLFN